MMTCPMRTRMPRAAEVVNERAVRIHTCFGLVCYLQKPREWNKGAKSVYWEHRRLYPLAGPERINTGLIEQFRSDLDKPYA